MTCLNLYTSEATNHNHDKPYDSRTDIHSRITGQPFPERDQSPVALAVFNVMKTFEFERLCDAYLDRLYA